MAGPFVGAAASWLHRTGRAAALGVGFLAGIVIGEAVYGVIHVSDSTGVEYWIAVGVASVALLVGVLARRAREAPNVALGLGATAVVAAGSYVA